MKSSKNTCSSLGKESIFFKARQHARGSSWACRNSPPAWVQSIDWGATALQFWLWVTLCPLVIYACLLLTSTKLGESKIGPSEQFRSQKILCWHIQSRARPKALTVAAKLPVSYPYLLWKNEHRFRFPNPALQGERGIVWTQIRSQHNEIGQHFKTELSFYSASV